MNEQERLAILPPGVESIDESVDRYLDFARDFHRVGASRVEPGTDLDAALSEIGLDLPPGVELRVAVNTEETFHVVFPPDPNVALEDEALAAVAGGNSASSAGSYGTASTIGCALSCVSSAGTASTVGTAGSAS